MSRVRSVTSGLVDAHVIRDRIAIDERATFLEHEDGNGVARTGFPGDALNIVLAVGNRDGQRVVVRAGGNPHVIGRDGHRLAITGVGRFLNRRDAARIEHDTPVAGFSVGRLE